MNLIRTLLNIATVSDSGYLSRYNEERNAWIKAHGTDDGFEAQWQADENRRLNQLDRWHQDMDEIRHEQWLTGRDAQIERDLREMDDRERASDINTERRLLGL